MKLEGQRPTQIIHEDPNSLPSPESVKQIAHRIQRFVHRGSVIDKLIDPGDTTPNSVEITVLEAEEDHDVWRELRRGIPAEANIYDDWDIEEGLLKPKEEYTITLGQTQHAGHSGLNEPLDEISLWSDRSFFYFKVYEDGRITKRSKSSVDIDPNPPRTPFDRDEQYYTPKPPETIPEKEDPISEQGLAELSRVMDWFEEMARAERLTVSSDFHRVDTFMHFG